MTSPTWATVTLVFLLLCLTHAVAYFLGSCAAWKQANNTSRKVLEQNKKLWSGEIPLDEEEE